MCTSKTRRDFFRTMIGGSLAGATLLEFAAHRAAWAQSGAAVAGTNLFNVQMVADGVYFAVSRPQAIINCNAAIFVGSKDVLVVDAHSKPSAASALLAQIKKDITPKPVRYLVDTHFHWDHAQGNAGYRAGVHGKFDIIASNSTKRLLSELSAARLRVSMDPNGKPNDAQTAVVPAIEMARQRLSAASTDQEKVQWTDRIAQLESYQAEMSNYSPTMPTITFDKEYVIKDRAHDLHIQFHGRAHTAGDVVVYCPQKKVVATGDAILSTLPFMVDSYPKEWPRTIDSVAKLDISFVLPGHGAVQQGRQRMTSQRNYLEELVSRVEAGKRDGQNLAQIQQSITVASLKSMQADGYGASLGATVQNGINTNVENVFNRLIL